MLSSRLQGSEFIEFVPTTQPELQTCWMHGRKKWLRGTQITGQISLVGVLAARKNKKEKGLTKFSASPAAITPKATKVAATHGEPPGNS